MQYNTISELFTGICSAIREKEGSTGLINHQDIPDRILALNTGGSHQIVELIPIMTANIFQDEDGKEWQALASTTHSADYDNYKAFDGSVNTAWANGYEAGSTTTREAQSWIGVKCPEKKAVVAYALVGGTNINYPTEWILQGSNDGKVWEDIHSKGQNTELANKVERIYLLRESVSYQYYRLYINSYAAYCLVAELQLIAIK